MVLFEKLYGRVHFIHEDYKHLIFRFGEIVGYVSYPSSPTLWQSFLPLLLNCILTPYIVVASDSKQHKKARYGSLNPTVRNPFSVFVTNNQPNIRTVCT